MMTPYDDPPKNTMSEAGGIAAIVGWVLTWIPVAGILIRILMGILAIVFSAVGLGQLPRYFDDGRGMATAGLILGAR